MRQKLELRIYNIHDKDESVLFRMNLTQVIETAIIEKLRAANIILNNPKTSEQENVLGIDCEEVICLRTS